MRARARDWPWFLTGALATSTVLRFPGLFRPLSSDEAGMSLVGRSVAPTADSVYGTYWVDRSPVVVGAWALSDQVAVGYGMRLFALVANAVLVWAVYSIANRLSGRFAARLATIAMVALLANPEFGAWMGKGEVFGTALVGVSLVCSLRALDRVASPSQVRICGFMAGSSAMLAVGMKQSLLGGFAFGAALVLGLLLSRRITVSHAVQYVVHAGLGALLPAVLVVAWVAMTPASVHSLWYQVVGFRLDAAAVLSAGHTSAPSQRAHGLWELARSSWLVPILLAWLATLPWLVRRFPAETAALLALCATDLSGVVLGGSYWRAYLIPLLLDAVLGLSLVAGLAGWRRVLSMALVAATCWASFDALHDFTRSAWNGQRSDATYSAGLAIHDVARREETIVSLYGSAEVVYASGLASPYQHLWSLPIRTLDPDLSELKNLLRSDDAPTWIVSSVPVNSWGLDRDRSLRALVSERYEVVQDECGVTVYHLEGDAPTLDVDCHATFRVWSSSADSNDPAEP